MSKHLFSVSGFSITVINLYYLFFFLPCFVQGQSAEQWVDSAYENMTQEERIGQLFMIRAHSNLPQEHIEKVKTAIKDLHVGGLCFFQGTPEKQAELTNLYQSITKIPLMVAIDAEWGLGMRFKELAISYPRQLTLGAIQDNSIIYQMGRQIGLELKAIGTHVNFAPVADVNNNPLNPVINDRSFGENRYNVAAKCFQYTKGMQDVGIMACAKHFPGHGDTDVDSHLELPVISHNRQRLDSIELYPFRVLSEKGVQSMMIAHLDVPALDANVNTPSTLSAPTIQNLLKETIGFNGIVFTDALEMKGVTKHYGPGEVAVKAFLAGNDMLVLPDNLEEAFARMVEAMKDGTISSEVLENRVKRILSAKYQLGLNKYEPVHLEEVSGIVNSPEGLALKRTLFEKSLTVVRNEKSLMPIANVQQRFVTVAIGSDVETQFQTRLESYISAEHLYVTHKNFGQEKKRFEEKMKGAGIVIVSLHDMSKYASRDFGLKSEEVAWINEIRKTKSVILVIFGSPYSLKFFDDQEQILLAFEDDPLMQDVAAQGLLGVYGIDGRLPVSAGSSLVFNDGLSTTSLQRLGYASPESMGMNSDSLLRIDTLVAEIIKKRVAPGCQILIAKEGRIVYEKSFGYHTYAAKQPVRLSHLYDLASLTKVAATTLSLMRLADLGQINVENSLGFYTKKLKGSNKARLKISQVMAHHAGLKSWIPFYKETMTASKKYPKPSAKFYRSENVEEFSIPITDRLFMSENYVSDIWDQLLDSEVRPPGRYRYSDLGFYILAELVKDVSGKPLDQYADQNFYSPMGLSHIGFRPTEKFSQGEIVPTEEDRYFRQQKVQGYVHDMGSAMLGGVSGHAGLFSNAHDLAVIMQMLMNHGYYGGQRFISYEKVGEFTKRIPGSTRRAIGFDMKELNPDKKTYTSLLASDHTFGHTGFTGTCIWNDPVHKITYIFLSNRTYPSSRNNRLNAGEYRERIHDIIYRSFLKLDYSSSMP